MDTKLTENDAQPVIINVVSENGVQEDVKNEKQDTHTQVMEE